MWWLQGVNNEGLLETLSVLNTLELINIKIDNINKKLTLAIKVTLPSSTTDDVRSTMIVRRSPFMMGNRVSLVLNTGIFI